MPWSRKFCHLFYQRENWNTQKSRQWLGPQSCYRKLSLSPCYWILLSRLNQTYMLVHVCLCMRERVGMRLFIHQGSVALRVWGIWGWKSSNLDSLQGNDLLREGATERVSRWALGSKRKNAYCKQCSILFHYFDLSLIILKFIWI